MRPALFRWATLSETKRMRALDLAHGLRPDSSNRRLGLAATVHLPDTS